MAGLNLGKVLGNELVTITIGKEKQKFTLHKQLLCESVEYFRAAFSAGGFQESHSSCMDMPEDDPEAFELFVHWLYRGEVRRATKLTDIDQFLKLYVFSEKFQEQLDGVWRNTSSTSPLRKWLIRLLVYNVWDDERSGTPEKKTFPLNTEELISLWQLFKDHEDLYASFFTQLHKHPADNPPPCPFESTIQGLVPIIDIRKEKSAILIDHSSPTPPLPPEYCASTNLNILSESIMSPQEVFKIVTSRKKNPDPVVLVVGPEKEVFAISQALLVDSIEYFRTAFLRW
ncbi:uncharacterized protein EAF02_000839 [Botrytis sinoallii]|uniref:uncharacterized protein n=1 Tax=Botrytis sinoallii TaxID=1463999 RepID=UPI0018FF7DAA|nr:uncharacterized protein EAF02_000839 [Botrytis sinoallii]KAF7893301.1 hypothetical protein EAF02_000839 [Botrytis sinoallii]